MAYTTKKYEEPAAYQSAYSDTINNLVNQVSNNQKFDFNPLTDTAYQSFAKQYNRLGQQANENTLANVATNTGGLASSYAVSAAAQAQNQYNEALTDKIPELEQAAYERYNNDKTYNLNALGTMADLDTADYNKYADDRNYDRSNYEYDNNFDYNKSTDDRNYDYQKSRDAASDKQWQKEYNIEVKNYNLDAKNTTISQFAASVSGRFGSTKSYDKLISSLKKNKPNGYKEKIALAQQARTELAMALKKASATASKNTSSGKSSSKKSSNSHSSSSSSSKSSSGSKATAKNKSKSKSSNNSWNNLYGYYNGPNGIVTDIKKGPKKTGSNNKKKSSKSNYKRKPEK